MILFSVKSNEVVGELSKKEMPCSNEIQDPYS